MAPKSILPRKKIADFIDNLYDGDLHAKRVLSLANATLGVLVSASLAVHAMGVPPKLIIFNGVLGGARAPHCQERRLQRDRFATTMTILNRSDCFGAARAGSEWPARHAHSSACPNA